MTNLEKAIVERMLKDPELAPTDPAPDLDRVNVASREFSGAGFLTEFAPAGQLSLFEKGVSLRWGKVGARLNDSSLDTGYLVYIDDGVLTGIEGYTYGEAWPEEVTGFEMYDLPE